MSANTLLTIPGTGGRHARLVPHARLANALGRCREGGAEPILEDHGLILFGHIFVHHRAITEAIYVSRIALLRSAPRRIADLGALHDPVSEALEVALRGFGLLIVNKIDEGIAETHIFLEVHGHVDEIVRTLETFCIQELEQHVPRVFFR